MKIWEWLSGKKTVIATILLIACGTPHLKEFIDPRIIEIGYYIGAALGTTGLAHKYKKR